MTKITSDFFNSIIPINDLCLAAGMICTSQKLALRHYETTEEEKLTVNIDRNEWEMREQGIYGNASDLADLLSLSSEQNYSEAFDLVGSFYKDIKNLPSSFPFVPFSLPTWGITDTCHPKDKELFKVISRMGLSKEIIGMYALEGSVKKVKSNESERVLAFPVGERGEDFIVYNGTTYRHVGDKGISIHGERLDNQICMVYETPLDFMAMMQSVQRTGIAPIIGRRFHMVMNDQKNLSAVCDYLEKNPGFMEVRTVLPRTEFGKSAFKKINEAAKGTAVNLDYLYGNFESILGKMKPVPSEEYSKWEHAQMEQKEVLSLSSDEENLQQPSSRHIGYPNISAGKKVAEVERKTGGLKM